MRETKNSQYPVTSSSSSSSSSSTSPTQNKNPQSCIGSFVKLISMVHRKIKNVICCGRKRRNKKGFQIPPSNDLKIRVTPPASFTHYGYGSLAREATVSKHSVHATKPVPLPLNFSSYNQNGSSEPTDDSDASSEGSVNDGLQIAWNPLYLPQYPGSRYYDPWLNHVYQSVTCNALYQDPINDAPSSIDQVNRGFDSVALNKNFKQYELWGPQGDRKQGDQTDDTVDASSYLDETCNSQENYNEDYQTAHTIDGSFYMISRRPFDPIGRPYNPFGPIERPWPRLPSSSELADLGFVEDPSFP